MVEKKKKQKHSLGEPPEAESPPSQITQPLPIENDERFARRAGEVIAKAAAGPSDDVPPRSKRK